jgi:hypothetical protein
VFPRVERTRDLTSRNVAAQHIGSATFPNPGGSMLHTGGREAMATGLGRWHATKVPTYVPQLSCDDDWGARASAHGPATSPQARFTRPLPGESQTEPLLAASGAAGGNGCDRP